MKLRWIVAIVEISEGELLEDSSERKFKARW